MSPLVSLHGVGVVLGRTRVFADLDLTLSSGDRVGIQGPNGIGKTSLLRLMATLIRPAAGSVSILGWKGNETAPLEVRRRIGYIAHNPALNAELTLRENLQLLGRLGGSEVSADDALEIVGLARVSSRLAKQASQGMLRRADLARLLLHRTDLLLLDEPFSGLDQEAVGIVDALVERTIRGGGCAAVVSHDPERFAGFDRVLTLRPDGAGPR